MIKNACFFVVIIVWFHLFSCTSNKIENKLEYYDTEKKKIKSSYSYVKGELHGEAFKYYEGGGVKEKMNFIDGKIHGKAFGFREDGALAVINYFKKGRLLKYESYYPSGTLESELIYDNENFAISRKEFYETGVLKPLELSVFSKIIENELNDSLSFICRIDNIKNEYYGRGFLVLTEKKERDTLAILGSYSNVFRFSVAETSVKSDTLFFDLMVDYLGDSSDYFSTSFGVRDLLPIEKNDSINK